jgi:S1-C subfamily serine protease
MNEIQILDAVERYIRGEMNPDERLLFENLRKTNPEIDQLVVEHTLFLQQMNRFGEWKKFRSALHDTHTHLAEQGKINSAKLKGKAKVIYLWKRYKRVAAIAAIIAGVTTFAVIAIVWSLSPKVPVEKFEQVDRRLKQIEKNVRDQNTAINNLHNSKTDKPITYTTGGTGFIIDPKGFLITNAHVIQGAKNIAVQNIKGVDYAATIVYTDEQRDIAILKIDDENFRPYTSIPYSISRSTAELSESIFTLGYPRNEIVYGEGYLSAKTGFNGDTLSCQIDIAANRGNSGSPILNKNGEVIGILNGRQTNTEGFVFAIRAKHIFNVLDDLKKDSTSQKIKLPLKSYLSGLDRTQQVKKIEDYIYLVKVR